MWGRLLLLAALGFVLGASDEAYAPGTTGTLEGRVGGKRTLVLLDDWVTTGTHSSFLGSLETRGHSLTYAMADEEFKLQDFGEFLFDNIMVMAPGLHREAAKDIISFVTGGGNAMVFASTDSGEGMRELGSLAGVRFDDKGTQVIDHFAYRDGLEVSAPAHTVIETGELLNNQLLLGRDAGKFKPILYSGIGHQVNEDNVLAARVLTGSSTAYSAAPGAPVSDFPESAGKNTLLVSAIQGRNNMRMIYSGSLSMCSNRYAAAPDTGNAAFCDELSKWALGERGILRATSIMHRREDGSAAELLLHQKERRDLPASLFPEPEIAKNSQVYRVMDRIKYSMTIEEYNQENGGWGPFAASDVQLEFIMLDPFERITLENNPSTGLFHTTFQVPDTYGIFKFRVLYRRVGYTVLDASTQVSLRPYKHDEFERFITAAFPYYTAAFSIMAGFFAFTGLFLYSSDK
ncbi:unnamed protein product [Chrysoparadoxa australica]